MGVFVRPDVNIFFSLFPFPVSLSGLLCCVASWLASVGWIVLRRT